jgi:hypothetical protein
LFANGHEPKQPGVLVRNRVDRDDLGTIDIDPSKDLAKRLFPELDR